MKPSDLKYLEEESDRMITSAINSSIPGVGTGCFQFKIYHHKLKEGLKRDRLRQEVLDSAISHFQSVGFVVADHPQFGMMRLTLDLSKAAFTLSQAKLFNERCKRETA